MTKFTEEINVEIDFDEARQIWRANKVRTPSGSFKYICGLTTHAGKVCRETGEKHKILHHKKHGIIYDAIFDKYNN